MFQSLVLEPGIKLCGSSLANRFDRMASALESERTKQFPTGHYLNPPRGAETSYFGDEEIRISGTDDAGLSSQCGAERGLGHWCRKQISLAFPIRGARCEWPPPGPLPFLPEMRQRLLWMPCNGIQAFHLKSCDWSGEQRATISFYNSCGRTWHTRSAAIDERSEGRVKGQRMK